MPKIGMRIFRTGGNLNVHLVEVTSLVLEVMQIRQKLVYHRGLLLLPLWVILYISWQE
jgi:hypothetical protein